MTNVKYPEFGNIGRESIKIPDQDNNKGLFAQMMGRKTKNVHKNKIHKRKYSIR